VNWLRQSTASQEVLLGPFLDDTDGKTAETALTIANTDIKVWKSGATSEASKNSGGATHIAAGRYYCVLDATDTDTVGPGELNVSVAGALPVKVKFCVLAANVYDVVFGTTALSTHTAAQVWSSGTRTLTALGFALASGDLGTDCIGSAQLATSGVQEIRDAITGFSGSLSVNASGMIRVADGTATGEIDTSSGRVQITEAQLAAVTDLIGAPIDISGSGATIAGMVLDTNVRVEQLTNTVGTPSLGTVAGTLDDIAANVTPDLATMTADYANGVFVIDSVAGNVGGNLIGNVGGNVAGNLGGDVGGKVLGGGPSAITGTGCRSDLRAWNGTAPNNLSSGRVDSTVGAMQTDVITSTALATSGVQEIRDAITGFSGPINLDSGGNVKVSDGTGANQIDTTSGQVSVIAADVATIATSVRDKSLTGSAVGSLGAAASTAATQATSAAANAANANANAGSAATSAASAAATVNSGSFGNAAIFGAVGSNTSAIGTLSNKIGAVTGTGDNTLLGLLRALARTDAPLPSDIGGTYDPTTHSLQSIVDVGVAVDVDEQAIADAVIAGLGDFGDPLVNEVPGAYPVGSAGWRLGMIGTAEITVVNPLSGDSELNLVKGDSYTAAFGRRIEWSSDDWPVLSGTDMTVQVELDDGRLIVAGEILSPTHVAAEFASADTNALGEGVYDYAVVAVSGDERLTLVRARCTVADREDS
jgi:hypothetical protein